MKPLWYENGAPVAADNRTPVDEIEPEPQPRRAIDLLRVVERVAGTFVRGNPRVTLLAWRVVLGAECDSMRKCAARAGCTAAAISHRAGVLAREFGLRPRGPRLREMRRGLALQAWERRRRGRTATTPPPGMDHPMGTEGST
ncbi:MAG TPA: hypothetical protein PLU30_22435 [Verrucomicrobiae bacterium]|nr:hypothetical protein [Verrucomicrobiae bacterium]